MRIGALAERTGVSVTTLRYYEKRGLLPAGSRTPGGYREYSDGDVKRVVTLLAAKRLGFTLQEIVQLLEVADDSSRADVVVAIVEDRLADVRKEASALKKLEDELASRLEEWNERAASKGDPLWLISGKTEE